MKFESSIPDVLPREAGGSFFKNAYHYLSLPHTGILALHASLSLFQVCMRLTLPCLHVCHSICMRTPWEGAIGMGERVGSYCGCTCSQSGTDGRGTSGKSGVKKLRRRALREKLNFLRRKPKRTGGSTRNWMEERLHSYYNFKM